MLIKILIISTTSWSCRSNSSNSLQCILLVFDKQKKMKKILVFTLSHVHVYDFQSIRFQSWVPYLNTTYIQIALPIFMSFDQWISILSYWHCPKFYPSLVFLLFISLAYFNKWVLGSSLQILIDLAQWQTLITFFSRPPCHRICLSWLVKQSLINLAWWFMGQNPAYLFCISQDVFDNSLCTLQYPGTAHWQSPVCCSSAMAGDLRSAQFCCEHF